MRISFLIALLALPTLAPAQESTRQMGERITDGLGVVGSSVGVGFAGALTGALVGSLIGVLSVEEEEEGEEEDIGISILAVAGAALGGIGGFLYGPVVFDNYSDGGL